MGGDITIPQSTDSLKSYTTCAHGGSKLTHQSALPRRYEPQMVHSAPGTTAVAAARICAKEPADETGQRENVSECVCMCIPRGSREA